MKFKDLMLVLPVAFLLVACGRSNGDSDSVTQTSTQSPLGGSPAPVQTTPPPTSGGGTTTPPPSSGGGSTSNCPANPSRSYYSFNFQGTGKQELLSPTSGTDAITADSKLRIGFTPLAAYGTSGTGGKMEYDKMGARISLVKNGIEIAYIDMITTDSSGKYQEGFPVGQMTNLAWADFSSYLSGTGKYYIKVSRIKTNKGCRDFCSANFWGCQSWQYSPYAYANYDYNNKRVVWCGDDMLNQCVSQQCGVKEPLDNAGWSLNVRVETDSTTCIQ